MTNMKAEELARLSARYQGKDPGEQEYELAISLVRIGEGSQTPDLGAKDFWLHVRGDLAKKVVELHIAIDATAVAAAEQVLSWATARGFDAVAYQIPLAILTAMIVDSVISAIGGGGDDGSADG